MKKNYFLWLLILWTGSLFAQQVHVVGTVFTSNSHETLPGVTVLVKGTTQGTVTDMNGNFSLVVPSKATLVFSFVGYLKQEVPVNGKTRMDIYLEPETKQLKELVVVGYGVQKKSDVTGSLVSLSGKEIQETHQQDVASILQGRAAGVNVTTNSGSPSSSMEINIRGVSSINGSPPLWVVDGVPTDVAVNPQDIQSIEILKDASATAIYGTKGANGVILITTKKGTVGKMQVHYQNRFSWGQLYKKLNLTTAKQWARLRAEAYTNAGLPVPSDLTKEYGEGTDWQAAVTRTAFSHNHYLSFSGGSKKLTWLISANYNNAEGIIKKSDAKYFDFRINTSGKLNKWLTVGENMTISNDVIHPINQNDEWNAIMIEAIAIDPITKVKNSDGSWGGSKFNTINNPVAHLDRTKLVIKDFSVGGDVYANITFLKDFVFSSKLGFSKTFSNNYDWAPTYFVKTGEQNAQTSVSRDYSGGYDAVFTNFLTWGHSFGKHNIKIMLGTEVEQNYNEWFGTSATDLISEQEHLIYIDNATGNQQASSYGSASEVRYLSYFGRVNYNYLHKYFLTVNLRRQGSSMFGPQDRWGNFPSASVGWRIDKENFMKSVKLISQLKLRAGYGISGNDLALVPYSYYATAQSGQRYVFGNKILDGVSFPRIANKELHWEEKSSLNIGVDVAMWEDRLTFSGDYFVDKTSQMLYDPPLPGHVGTQEMPFTNVASMQNTGFEFILGYKNSFKKFRYNVSLNFSHVNNKVLDLGGATSISSASFMQLGYISRTEVGHPMASFYGYVCDGIFQTQADVDHYVTPDGNLIQPNAKPGDIRYKADENGKLITDFIGSPFPDFTAGLNLNMSYKNYNLILFFYGVYGNQIFNATKFYTFNSSARYNLDEKMMGRWMKAGDTDDPNLARMNLNDANNSLRSDRFVEDGSYLRLKTLQFQYTLPQNKLSKYGLGLSVFVGADNLFTLTKYTGFDPEVGIGYNNNPLDRGIDRARYPSPRTFYLGLNLTIR